MLLFLNFLVNFEISQFRNFWSI